VQAPLFLVWLIDLNRLTKLAEERGEHAGALDYLESFLLGAVDATLAAQNAVVALESLGLGAVYIGGIRNKPAEQAAELNLPPQVFALFGVVVGKPDPATPASVKPRLPQQAVLFHKQDEWGAVQHEAVAAYNPRIREFQREQGMPEQNWTAQCVTPSRSTAAMCCVTWCTSSVLS
jgi:Nitroreductase family